MSARRPGLAARVAAHVALVAFTIATLLPVLMVIRKAVTPGHEFALDLNPIPPEVTLDHFRAVLGRTNQAGVWIFGRQLANSLLIAGATTAVGIALACSAAYAFSRFRFPGRDAGLGGLLVVQMFPATLLVVPLYVLLDRLHLLDSTIGLVLVYSTSSLPFCVWMLKGYFDTLPRELEEAARIDGASRAGVFWHVVLPLARPAIAVTALFSFMSAWNEYILAETFLAREEAQTLPVMLQHFVGQHSTEWGHFAAGAVIVSVPVTALFYYLQRHLVAGLTAGAVKG